MKIKTLIIATMLLLSTMVSAQNFSPYDLQCEYLDNPLAINTTTPKFSWRVAATDRGFKQAGYEIVVSNDEGDLNKASHGNMWTIKNMSDQSLHIPYKGKQLEAGQRYYWKVRVLDKSGKPSQWSAVNSFAVGLLSPKDWSGAEWIAMEIMSKEQRIVPGLEYNKLQTLGDRTPGTNKLPQFRKEVSITKPIKRATIYASGLGQFDLYLNGAKVGDHFMDPAWTDFDKFICYVPFDVTNKLQQGGNALGMMLGNGFISVPKERYYKALISYCYPQMILKLVVEYQDGTSQTVVSDKSWKTTESPVGYSSIFGGEDFDATKVHAGWLTKGYDDSAWQNVLIANQPGQLIAQSALPVKVMQEFPTVTFRKTRHGKWLYDLGQNFTGTVRLSVKGKRGQSVVMNTCELFNTEVDSITTHGGYRGEYRLTYTLNGTGCETWHPQFTYFGFRYVLVSGAVPAGVENPDGLPVVENITGLHIRNSTRTTGTFECSNELLNKTHNLINWGIKGNMTSFLTDCPHREKFPWIEQLHLMFGSLQSNFDLYKLYEKMINDMALAQFENGLIPDITPMYAKFNDGFIDSPEWGSAFILAPWKVYEYYGDRSLLEKHYDQMKRYIDYLTTKATDHILSHGLGDWCDIGPKSPAIAQLTSLAGTATPTYYMDAVTMHKTALLLGKTKDAETFAKLAANIKKSYNQKYFNKEGGYYDMNSQAGNAIAICAGLVEPQNKKAVIDNIIKDIRSRGNALTAGDVGYTYVLRALEDNGASQVIYDMNSRYDVYGYGYMLAQGATALPESWQALAKKSHNHFMLGHLQEWFYTHVGGIRRDDSSLAYKTFTVKPEIVGNITFANVSFESPYGTITNRWKKSSDKFEMKLEIPANTEATIWVPVAENALVTESGVDASLVKELTFLRNDNGYKLYKAGSGTYRFNVTER